MNNIKATYNIDSKQWAFEDLGPDTPMKNELQIAFCADAMPAIFTSLSFGYEILDTSKEIPGEGFLTANSFPKFGEAYEKAETSRPFCIDTINYQNDTTYKIKVWASNNSERTTGEYIFTVPKPNKEFNSWVWNDQVKNWEAPIPRPTGVPARWDDATESWITITDGNLIPVKPEGFNSWVWDADANSFVAPVPRPTTDGVHTWDEAGQTWVTVTLPGPDA
jgi:hypothetical protein